MEERKVYLDNNATTPLHPAVKQKIIESLDYFGNPSSAYTIGQELFPDELLFLNHQDLLNRKNQHLNM